MKDTLLFSWKKRILKLGIVLMVYSLASQSRFPRIDPSVNTIILFDQGFISFGQTVKNKIKTIYLHKTVYMRLENEAFFK